MKRLQSIILRVLGLRNRRCFAELAFLVQIDSNRVPTLHVAQGTTAGTILRSLTNNTNRRQKLQVVLNWEDSDLTPWRIAEWGSFRKKVARPLQCFTLIDFVSFVPTESHRRLAAG